MVEFALKRIKSSALALIVITKINVVNETGSKIKRFITMTQEQIVFEPVNGVWTFFKSVSSTVVVYDYTGTGLSLPKFALLVGLGRTLALHLGLIILGPLYRSLRLQEKQCHSNIHLCLFV